jgi:hypothetical protein
MLLVRQFARVLRMYFHFCCCSTPSPALVHASFVDYRLSNTPLVDYLAAHILPVDFRPFMFYQLLFF